MKYPSQESISARAVRVGSKYVAPTLREYDADARHLQRALIDKRDHASWRVNLAYLLVVAAAMAITFYPWS